MNLYRSTLIASLLVLASQSSLLAQDSPKEKPAKSDAAASDSTLAGEEKRTGDETERANQPKPNEIDELVAQLDHERLTKRQQAQKKLLGMGKAAIPALAKAALSGKRETIEKSIDVLAKLAQSQDEAIQDAARVTLQMLSESEKPSTADRAKLALNSKEADGIKPFEGWDKPGSEFAGGGQRNRSVSVFNINGVRSINVKEGGRETTIQELSGGRLFVSITGGEEPIELTARNLEDLRKKQPDAAALYEQVANNQMPAGLNLPGDAFGKGTFNGIGGNGSGVAFGNGFAFGNGVAINNGNVQQQGFGFGGTSGVEAKEMLIKQLQELKQRMKDHPAMQSLFDQQIQAITDSK